MGNNISDYIDGCCRLSLVPGNFVNYNKNVNIIKSESFIYNAPKPRNLNSPRRKMVSQPCQGSKG